MKTTVLFILCFSFSIFCFAQEQTIKGKVIDEYKITLPFVNVSVKNSTQEKTTDLQGNFSVNIQPRDTLLFAFLGYKTQEIVVGNQKEITVTLEVTEYKVTTPEIVVLKKAIDTQKVGCNSKQVIRSSNE